LLKLSIGEIWRPVEDTDEAAKKAKPGKTANA
jgi:hypothetical protein